MPINWTNIEGYRDDMSAEEKLALLENQPEPAPPEPAGAPREPAKPAKEPKLPDKPGYILKAQYDKLASEYAATKKQLRSRMTEEEMREAERKAADEAKDQELERLRREKTVSGHKASFLSLGYDDKMAAEMAEMLADGDMDGLFAGMKRRSADAEKAMRQKILSETPVPPAGTLPDKDEKEKQAENRRRYAIGLPPLK